MLVPPTEDNIPALTPRLALKTVGDWVESGEIIGRAGKSGGQRMSGLYFEIRQKGSPKDPIGWLAKR